MVNGAPRADSRDIAAFFKKTHRSVLQTIDSIIEAEPDLALHEIVQGSYTVPETGQHKHRRFLLTRDAFSLVAMGFTGAPALKWKRAYIAAFNAMEAEIRSRQTPAPVGIDVRDPAQLSAITLQLIQVSQELAGKLATVEAVVEEQRPMVDAYHAFLDDEGLCGLATAASAIEAPQSLFFAWMRERGFLFDRDGYPQARADLRKDGYFKLRTVPGEYHRMRGQTMVTRAGLVWLRHRWLAGPGKVIALQAAVAAKQGHLPGI